jgi:metallothiol transferase
MQNQNAKHIPHNTPVSRRVVLQTFVLAAYSRNIAFSQSSGVAKAVGINHVTCSVSDVEKSGTFYEHIFGSARVTANSQSYLFIDGRGEYLSIQHFPNRPVGIDHVCLSIEGFDAASIAGRLKKMGVSVEPELGGTVDGQHYDWVFFRDPAGNRIQLMGPDSSVSPNAKTAPGAAQSSLVRPIGLNHFTIYVAHLDQIGPFYEKIFGVSRHGTDPESFEFRLNERNEYFSLTQVRGNGSTGLDHLCWSIADYSPSVTRQALKSAGVRVEENVDPEQVFFRDPDGIRLQVTAPDRRR